MRLTTAIQIPFEDVLKQRLSTIIAASGYEARATHAAQRLNGVSHCRKVAFAFTNHRNTLSRRSNDRVFESLGYALPPTDGGAPLPPEHFVEYLCTPGQPQRVAIAVDYSSMPRLWYASLLSRLWSAPSGPRQMDLYLLYTPAAFSPPAPAEGIPLDRIGPLPGFSGLASPHQPNALIAGLGYDKHTALALYQRVEPASAYALYADPGSDPAYVLEAKGNNRDFLSALPRERIFTYDFHNLDMIAMMLNSLVSGLVYSDHRIIIAPLGPKPFCMLSLVLALRESEKTVDVWRVSAGLKAQPIQRQPRPDGAVLAFWVRFER